MRAIASQLCGHPNACDALLEGRTPCAWADSVRPSTGGSDGTSPSNPFFSQDD
ncbi:hypothetical protein [Pontiella desulfatans]|uniref:hypothetical protein n=1 Tax=Pontiella desulfatans TaxID=2750659 RepID=UPI001443AE6A|nr:hypothetical protein [Pontiella desulfatans]